jgi:hypothetical protein
MCVAAEPCNTRDYATSLPLAVEGLEEIAGECSIPSEGRSDGAALVLQRRVMGGCRQEKTLPIPHPKGWDISDR